MSPFQNCWEYFQCGREPGGSKSDSLGVCPVAVQSSDDGRNHGRMGGRLCWTIAGSPCAPDKGLKFRKCVNCTFFAKVMEEEGRNFDLGMEARPKKPAQ
ncbi:MAG: hypothetical protein DWQ01_21040 [Planctomycetota bacterium]|nr:MAG: hypothetical protein DWQ01_21040 [Planctomycetota bacterium]